MCKNIFSGAYAKLQYVKQCVSSSSFARKLKNEGKSHLLKEMTGKYYMIETEYLFFQRKKEMIRAQQKSCKKMFSKRACTFYHLPNRQREISLLVRLVGLFVPSFAIEEFFLLGNSSSKYFVSSDINLFLGKRQYVALCGSNRTFAFSQTISQQEAVHFSKKAQN